VRFSGFGPRATEFYAGLAAENTKAFFDAHRELYEEHVREPLELLVADLAPEFGAAKVFRPNRDVRFSADKSPYKLQAAAVLVPDDAHTARYVALDADGLLVAAGLYDPDRGQLERMRRAIVHDRFGGELEEEVARLAGRGLRLGEPALRTAPRGVPRDHPRIALLRHKRIAVSERLGAGPWLERDEARDRVVERWRAAEGLCGWLDRHAGPRDPYEAEARRPGRR
jgi:uncharacterized protein (TIGR02453 family)